MMKKVWILVRLMLHIVYGLVLTAILWPLFSKPMRTRIEQRYALRLLAILRVRLEIEFESPESDYAQYGPFLICSNHVSWLDIFAFNAHQPVTFIAKSEVSQWPLVGILATRTGTLFVERGRRHAVRQVIQDAVKVLEKGRTVAVFPEGTTAYGDTPLPFHNNFLQPAIHARVPLLPVSLQYFDHQGRFTRELAFVGEQTILDNIRVLLNSPEHYTVRLFIHAPITTEAGASRHQLSDMARGEIAKRCASVQ